MTDSASERIRRPAGRGRWGTRQSLQTDQGSVWPSPSQVLLLKAGLSTERGARDAWEHWLTQADLEAPDPSSGQVLPLVYSNLRRNGLDLPSMGRLKLHYMAAWAKNQRLFALLGRTLRPLSDHGIDTLVLKGAALVPLFYRDEGARGMGDFDVLVPETKFHDACSVLQAHGWKPLYHLPEHFDTRFEHAIAFLEPAGDSVDLHCHVLIESCERNADDAFWEASRPLEIQGTKARTLCDTDHLLQVLAHGLTWVKSPPVRWVADAMTILREAGVAIDWDRLATQAVERGVTLKVLATVEYLRSTFDADIPTSMGQSLAQAPGSRSERRRYHTLTRNKRGRPVSLLRHHWSMYHRGIAPSGPLKRITAVPQYLRFWAQTDRLWTIPLTLGAKAWRVVGRRLGLYQYWDGT